MKKKLLILFVCVISVLGASATDLFTSSCGKQAYTVGPDYFETTDEAINYYMELDDILCSGTDEEDEEDTGEGSAEHN